jgi:hypothetical protein
MLISNPTATAAITIPTGVASADGGTYFVPAASGTGSRIDALDAETGAVAWSTAAADLPVLALPDALLAIRGAVVDDATWSGPGALVAIHLAAPHAVRAGSPFTLPQEKYAISDVRVDGGALHATWIATSMGSPATPPPPPIIGTLRIDLATGAAVVHEGAPLPAAVRQAFAGMSQWLAPWRTRGGWSALVGGGAAAAPTMTLRHWPDAGDARSIELLAGPDVAAASAVHANAQHAFVRACDRTNPARCELRVYDAETGARVRTLPDPIADQLEVPFALVGDRWLAVRREPSTLERTLVVFSAATVAAGPRWRRAIPPGPTPDLRP